MSVSRRWILLEAIVFGLFCGGCSDDGRLETYPVLGQVIVNGEPAAGCTVTYVPRESKLRGLIMPGGKTDEEGRFELTTYESKDGAPAGQYDVTLRWPATQWPGRAAAMQRSADPVPPRRPDLLMGQFRSPEKSPITVTVTEGTNELEPFRLDNVRLLPGAE